MSAAPPEPPVLAPLGAAGFQAWFGATDAQVRDLARYGEMLAAGNEVMNLVGPASLPDYWRRHVVDSAQLLKVLPEPQRWADLGSGAGLPGVVLACLLKGRPNARVYLVESMAKRCRFLTQVVEALPCGSASISSTRSPTAASAVPRLMAVVVLPTPPFWLATASTRNTWSDPSARREPGDFHDPPPGIALARVKFRLEFPIFSGFGQLSHNILTLEEEPPRALAKVGPREVQQP